VSPCEGGCISYIYGISIPPNEDDSFFLDLVLSSGIIKGRIVDSITSNPLEKGAHAWKVRLGKRGGRKFMGEVTGTESRFEVHYVAPGAYSLMVNVPGYRSHLVESVTVGEGAVVDLGDIPVAPCGILQVEAVSTTGEPIQFFAYCNGERIGQFEENVRELGKGKKLFTQLPTGKAVIEVSANDHQSRKYSIELLPARIVTLRAELTPVK
jgi:hypothetical protein